MSPMLRIQTGARAGAKAGVTRRDDAEPLRQAIEERPVLRRVIAAVQEQQRWPVALDQHFERDFADIGAFHLRLS